MNTSIKLLAGFVSCTIATLAIVSAISALEIFAFLTIEEGLGFYVFVLPFVFVWRVVILYQESKKNNFKK